MPGRRVFLEAAGGNRLLQFVFYLFANKCVQFTLCDSVEERAHFAFLSINLKFHAAVCKTTIEQRVVLALYFQQTTDVEPMCLDVPRRTYRIHPLAD